MDRRTFDMGLDFLTNNFGGHKVSAAVSENWYQQLMNIQHWEWRAICKRIAADLDSFPKNFPKVVIGYSDKGERTREERTPDNPETGRPYTGEECYQNLCRLEQLKRSTYPEHASRNKIIGCAVAAERDSDFSKWGSYIIGILDADIEREGNHGSDNEQQP